MPGRVRRQAVAAIYCPGDERSPAPAALQVRVCQNAMHMRVALCSVTHAVVLRETQVSCMSWMVTLGTCHAWCRLPRARPCPWRRPCSAAPLMACARQAAWRSSWRR